MHFQDQSLGFELSLPDGWRKLFIFEQVNQNPFKSVLPFELTDGPVLIGPAGDSMVITIQRTKQRSLETCREMIRDMAEKSNLIVDSIGSIRIQLKPHATVIWRGASEKQRLKTYFIEFGQLRWNLTLLLNEHEGYYDQMIETFNVLPLVQKMMS